MSSGITHAGCPGTSTANNRLHAAHSTAEAARIRVRRYRLTSLVTGAPRTEIGMAFPASTEAVSQPGACRPRSTKAGSASGSIMLDIAKMVLTAMSARNGWSLSIAR